VQAVLRDLPPGDSVRLLTRLDRAEQLDLLDLLPVGEAAQLLKELSVEQAAERLGLLSPERAAALIEHFPSNEQTDLLAALDDQAAPILALLSTQTAGRVRALSQYPPDTAGGMMVAEFLVFPETLSVSEVVENFRSRAG
jgi:magnesium transporter